MDSQLRHEPHFTPVKIDETSALLARDLAYAQAVFSRRLDGRVLRFRWDGSAIRDTATDSRWSATTGTAVAGRLGGSTLRPLPFTFPYWFAWHSFHPRTVVARP